MVLILHALTTHFGRGKVKEVGKYVKSLGNKALIYR